MSAIIVEQNAARILAITDQALILERGTVVHAATSAALRADGATLERYLAVGGRIR
jgi:branched-chain amino acid transport system ATP-binding protein